MRTNLKFIERKAKHPSGNILSEKVYFGRKEASEAFKDNASLFVLLNWLPSGVLSSTCFLRTLSQGNDRRKGILRHNKAIILRWFWECTPQKASLNIPRIKCHKDHLRIFWHEKWLGGCLCHIALGKVTKDQVISNKNTFYRAAWKKLLVESFSIKRSIMLLCMWVTFNRNLLNSSQLFAFQHVFGRGVGKSGRFRATSWIDRKSLSIQSTFHGFGMLQQLV